jgi:flagellar hook-associated protein 2
MAISLNLTGLDTDTIIQQLMAIERQPLKQLESRKSILAQRKSAWDSIRTKMGNVSSRLASLTGVSTFGGKKVTVQNSAVVSASASPSALSGSYNLRVTSLASGQIAGSGLFTSRDSPLGISGVFTLNGQDIQVDITDTLSSIAEKINACVDIGVEASVLQTEPSKYRLVLASSQVGSAGVMSFGSDVSGWQALGVIDPSGVVNEIQAAQDAVFTLNGIQFTRHTNTVSDAVPGLTLELNQAVDPKTGLGGVTTINVSPDDDGVVEYVKQFIFDYNTLIDTIKSFTSYDADARAAGLLFGDPLLQRLLVALREVIFDRVDGALPGFETLASVGVTTGAPGSYNKDGKIVLDEVKLREALAADRDAVMTLFGAKAPNVALGSFGASVTASSTYGPGYEAGSVIDGSGSSLLWGQGGGWSDGTPGVFPDFLEIDFGVERTIDRIGLYTLNSAMYPADGYGVRDFEAEYWDEASSSWISLFTVTGNTQEYVSQSFDPVETNKIRINVTGSNDGQHSRICEVQAFSKNDGAFSRLQDVVRMYTSSDGLLLGRTEEIDRLDRDLSRQIESMQRRLDMRMESLRKKFTALEVMLQQFNSQSAWLSQQLMSLSLDRQNG